MTGSPRAEHRAPRNLITRRFVAQLVAGAAGVILTQRAVTQWLQPRAFASDEDEDSGRGRGRGRGRGGRGSDDDHGHGHDGNDDIDDERDDDEGQGAITSPQDVPAGSAEVRIVSDDAGGFVPGEVTIDAGSTVTFVNTHSDEHTATGSGFDTGIIPEGGSATVTLREPGTFAYACQIHPEMTGVVNVRGADGRVPARQGTPVPEAAATVSISDLAFQPAELSIEVGGTVVWVNDDSVPHTVTAEDGDFDSGIFDPGSNFSWAFDEAGTFAYACQLHPRMQGTITVGDGLGRSGAAATPAAQPGESP